MPPLRVIVWNEHRHERRDERVRAVYPDGIHAPIAAALRAAGHGVVVATLDEPEHGLGEAALAQADVLVWWGHTAHREVDDAVVDRLQRRVLEGLGLVVLHSAHHSKIFRRLMGTTANLKWREGDDRERLWVVAPGHPITDGLGESIVLEREEMYGEPFDVPPPETLVFVSWFSGGEVFRSGGCYTRGRGKIFYFRPGHETLPTYHQPEIQRVIVNAVGWAAPVDGPPIVQSRVAPLEGAAR